MNPLQGKRTCHIVHRIDKGNLEEWYNKLSTAFENLHPHHIDLTLQKERDLRHHNVTTLSAANLTQTTIDAFRDKYWEDECLLGYHTWV